MLRNEFRCIFTYTQRRRDHRRHRNNVREYKNCSLPIVHEKYTRELGITHTMRWIPLSFHGHMFFFFSFSSFYSMKIFLRNILLNKKKPKDFGLCLLFFVSSLSVSTRYLWPFIVHIRIAFDTTQHHLKSLTLILPEIMFVDVLCVYVFVWRAIFGFETSAVCLPSNPPRMRCNIAPHICGRVRCFIVALRVYSDATIKLMMRYVCAWRSLYFLVKM